MTQPTLINPAIAKARSVEEIARAAAARSVRNASSASTAASATRDLSGVTIRFARPDESEAIERLADLDGRGRRFRPRRALVAEVDGRIVAAWSVDDGTHVGDPFRPTQPLVALLGTRAAQLRGAVRPRRLTLPRLRPRIS